MPCALFLSHVQMSSISAFFPHEAEYQANFGLLEMFSKVLFLNGGKKKKKKNLAGHSRQNVRRNKHRV